MGNLGTSGLRLALPTVVTYLLLGCAGYAESCGSRVLILQDQALAALDASVEHGRSGPESPAATMHRQPTPRSMAAAEEALGGLSPERVEAFRSALLRARDAAAAGDEVECRRAADIAEALLKGE